MKHQKVIIIDDERLARLEMKTLIEEFQHLEVIAEAANADEGILLIEQLKPDLIFLDIHMPEKSGFDLLEELDEAPAVIFTTAFDEHAIKAFEFNALDYLLKPIQADRFKLAIDRILNSKNAGKVDETLANTAPLPDHVFLKDGQQSHFIKLAEISLFSSFGNYVKVHFGEKPILVHRSLNHLEQRGLPAPFFRANRYTIINVDHIQSIRQGLRNKLVVVLNSGHEIELSERKSILFRSKWSI